MSDQPAPVCRPATLREMLGGEPIDLLADKLARERIEAYLKEYVEMAAKVVEQYKEQADRVHKLMRKAENERRKVVRLLAAVSAFGDVAEDPVPF